MIPDEKSHDLGTRRRIMQKTKWPIFLTILGVRIPVVQKPFQTKSSTSIVARVFLANKRSSVRVRVCAREDSNPHR